jgi:hypothetical protein
MVSDQICVGCRIFLVRGGLRGLGVFVGV